jgi:hypothetical protein
MRRTKISSTDLNFEIQEQLKGLGNYPFQGISIAIVPTDRGWMAVMTAKDRKRWPEWFDKIKALEKRLQKTYALEKD